MGRLSDIGKMLKQKTQGEIASLELITSQPLAQELLIELRNSIDEELKIKHTIDPKLSGGITIKLGDLTLDADLDRRIDNLEEFLSGSEMPDLDLVKHFEKQIEKFQLESEPVEVGTVTSVKDGTCYIDGLTNCVYQEMLELPNGVRAIALNLETSRVGAVILGDYLKIKAGDIAKRTGRVAEVGVGEELLGRVVNPLAEPLDGMHAPQIKKYYPIERVAPGVMMRQPVTKPLQTGVTAVDALVPIGRGQRELILGDRQTGKTAIAIDAILNQKGKNVICIYVAIGQKDAKLARIVAMLKEKGAMDYTIVVSAGAADSASMQYLAPYSGTAMAEYFADLGKDVLVIYDDLTKHAVAYRELSLLLRRPPGREAYPGDVFYLHSRLLERACSLSDAYGGGTITALPIIETQAGDISAYIPTNVISITDGQIFLESDLFYRGIRPAINVGLSVSRVGSAAQSKPLKKVSSSIKLALAQYRELESFAQFAGELDKDTKEQLERGKRIIEILKQKSLQPRSDAEQVVLLYAVTKGLLDSVDTGDISKHIKPMIDYIATHQAKAFQGVSQGEWDEKIAEKISSACQDYIQINVKPEANKI